MGQLTEFRCTRCGHKEWAPDNGTGRYAVMSGTIQMFYSKAEHKIRRIHISTSYLMDDDMEDDAIALEAIRKVVESGNADYDPLFPLSVELEHREKLSPWNARTCGCPRCGARMKANGFMCMMVD